MVFDLEIVLRDRDSAIAEKSEHEGNDAPALDGSGRGGNPQGNAARGRSREEPGRRPALRRAAGVSAGLSNPRPGASSSPSKSRPARSSPVRSTFRSRVWTLSSDACLASAAPPVPSFTELSDLSFRYISAPRAGARSAPLRCFSRVVAMPAVGIGLAGVAEGRSCLRPYPYETAVSDPRSGR